MTDYFSELPEDEVYTTFFSHNGIKLAGAFTKNKAVVVIPRGFHVNLFPPLLLI